MAICDTGFVGCTFVHKVDRNHVLLLAGSCLTICFIWTNASMLGFLAKERLKNCKDFIGKKMFLTSPLAFSFIKFNRQPRNFLPTRFVVGMAKLRKVPNAAAIPKTTDYTIVRVIFRSP